MSNTWLLFWIIVVMFMLVGCGTSPYKDSPCYHYHMVECYSTRMYGDTMYCYTDSVHMANACLEEEADE